MPRATVPLARGRLWPALVLLITLPWLAFLPGALIVFTARPDLPGAVLLLFAAGTSAVTWPFALQVVRALFTRPRLWLAGDAIVIHDPVLFRRDVRVERVDVEGAGDAPWERFQVDPYGIAEMSPLRERPNLEIRLRRPVGFEAARGGWSANWIWRLERPPSNPRRPRFPQGGDRYSRLWLRSEDPAAAAEAMARWAAERR